jgi:hypothetical protein
LPSRRMNEFTATRVGPIGYSVNDASCGYAESFATVPNLISHRLALILRRHGVVIGRLSVGSAALFCTPAGPEIETSCHCSTTLLGHLTATRKRIGISAVNDRPTSTTARETRSEVVALSSAPRSASSRASMPLSVSPGCLVHDPERRRHGYGETPTSNGREWRIPLKGVRPCLKNSSTVRSLVPASARVLSQKNGAGSSAICRRSVPAQFAQSRGV